MHLSVGASASNEVLIFRYTMCGYILMESVSELNSVLVLQISVLSMRCLKIALLQIAYLSGRMVL